MASASRSRTVTADAFASGVPLSVDVDTRILVLRNGLVLRVDIDPGARAAAPCRFRLSSPGGQVDQARTIAEDRTPDAPRAELHLADARPGPLYTLELAATGDDLDAHPSTLFADLPFEQLKDGRIVKSLRFETRVKLKNSKRFPGGALQCIEKAGHAAAFVLAVIDVVTVAAKDEWSTKDKWKLGLALMQMAVVITTLVCPPLGAVLGALHAIAEAFGLSQLKMDTDLLVNYLDSNAKRYGLSFSYFREPLQASELLEKLTFEVKKR